MAPQYEYAIAIESARLAEPTEFEKVDAAQVLAPGMGKVAERLASAAEQIDGGGWEAVSHSFATHGNTLLISFLLRRPH